MRRLYLLLASLTLMAALFAVVPFDVAFASGGPGHHVGPNKYKGGVAPSATCATAPSEGNCTGQDPVAQGCQYDAYTVSGGIWYLVDDVGQIAGEVDLRYSAACQSNWSRTLLYSQTGDWISATIFRQTDNKTYGYYLVTATSVYSDMVYAPGTVKAKACGSIRATWSGCTPFI